MAAVSQKAVSNVFYFNENIWIAIKISGRFVPRGLIKNIPALVQIMVWLKPGDKPLSEAMIVRLLTHVCITRPQWIKGLIPPNSMLASIISILLIKWIPNNIICLGGKITSNNLFLMIIICFIGFSLTFKKSTGLSYSCKSHHLYWALTSSPLNKRHTFLCMDKLFCVEFQRLPLKFPINILPIHTGYPGYFQEPRWKSMGPQKYPGQLDSSGYNFCTSLKL